MDSDTTDRQIQDLDTGYEKANLNIEQITKTGVKVRTLQSAFPNEENEHLNKIQVVIQIVSMILILILASVVVVYFLHKFELNFKQNIHKLPEEQVLSLTPSKYTYTNEELGFYFQYPREWQLQDITEGLLELKTSNNKLLIFFMETNDYLTSERIEIIKESLIDKCESYPDLQNLKCLINTEDYDKTITSSTFETIQLPLEVESNNETFSNPIYIFRLEKKENIMLVVTSFENDSSKDVHSFAETVLPL